MAEQRVCVTATDRLGASSDEEAWVPLDVQRDYPAWVRAVDGFVAYLAERGVAVAGLHVGTEEWVRDYPRRTDAGSGGVRATG